MDQLWEDLSLQVLESLLTSIFSVTKTDLNQMKENASKYGADAIEVFLSRAGCAVDDWKSGEALDRRLEKIRAAKL